MKTRLYVLMLCLVCAAPASNAAEPVKVGALMGVTGPIASYIPPILNAAKLAEKEINEHGGLLDGRPMQLVVADTQAATQPAVDAASKLVNVEQVVAIVGALTSGSTLAAAESVIIPAKILQISPTATAPKITDLVDNDFVFRTVPSDNYQGQVLARIVQDSGISKVAVAYVNNDYGVGIANTFKTSFEKIGGKVTGFQMHEDKKNSYRGELATLAKGKPDALVTIAYAGGSGLKIVKQSLEAGLFDRFIGTDGLRDQALIDQLGGDALKTSFFSSPTSPEQNPAKDILHKNYTANYNEPADKPFVDQTYDSTMLIGLAIEKAGSTDRTAIRDALRAIANAPGEIVGPGDWAKAKALIAAGKDINYEGASGSLDFDAAGDVAGYIGKFEVQGNVYKQTQVFQ